MSKIERGITKVDRECWYGWAGDEALGVYRSGPNRSDEATAKQDARRHAENIEKMGTEAPW